MKVRAEPRTTGANPHHQNKTTTTSLATARVYQPRSEGPVPRWYGCPAFGITRRTNAPNTLAASSPPHAPSRASVVAGTLGHATAQSRQ
jgi:hypothetical protein